MLRLVFHPDARSEVFGIIEYYEGLRGGLGTEFLESLEEALESICSMPEAYPATGSGVRRILLRRFPYAVIYSETEESVQVWAVIHVKRRPGYWRKRLSN